VRTRITCNRATYLLPRSHDRSSHAPWLHGHTPPSPLCHPCHRRLKQARLKRVLCQDVVPAGPPPRYNCFHFPLQNPSPKFILTLTCLECSTRLGGLWDPLHCTLRFGVSLLAGFAHLEVIIFDFHQQWLAMLLLSSVCFRSFDQEPGEGVPFRFVLRIRVVCQSLVEVDRSRSLYVLR
jgi:hypothetical protein